MKKKMVTLLLCLGLLLAMSLPVGAAITDEAPNYIVLVKRHTGSRVEYGMCWQFRNAQEDCTWWFNTKGDIVRLSIRETWAD